MTFTYFTLQRIKCILQYNHFNKGINKFTAKSHAQMIPIIDEKLMFAYIWHINIRKIHNHEKSFYWLHNFKFQQHKNSICNHC